LEAASPAETKFATLLADPVAEGTSLDESPLKPPFLYRPWSYLILLGLAGALAFWLVSFGPLSSKRQNPAAESPAMTQQPASATPAAGPSGTSGNSDSAVPEGAPPLDAGKTTAPATQVSPPDNKAPESTNPPNPAPVAPLERKSAAIQPPHPGPKKPRESGQPTTEQPIAPQQLSGTIMEANLIRKVKPAYPTVAREARVQGAVEFTAIVSKEGNIAKLHLVRGQPLLVKAAQEAVIQWKYRPILINGKPVEVATQIIVDFTLTPATP